MDIDPERTTGLDIIQIGTMNVPIEESGKRPVVPSNQVVTPTQKGSVANDHEASESRSRPECFLPRWCPLWTMCGSRTSGCSLPCVMSDRQRCVD
jgi:hypothetical protein